MSNITIGVFIGFVYVDVFLVFLMFVTVFACFDVVNDQANSIPI